MQNHRELKDKKSKRNQNMRLSTEVPEIPKRTGFWACEEGNCDLAIRFPSDLKLTFLFLYTSLFLLLYQPKYISFLDDVVLLFFFFWG